MAGPVATMFSTNLRGWLSARGFVAVIVAALVPTILTAAWIGTHQADVVMEEITWQPNQIIEGDEVTFMMPVSNAGRATADPVNVNLEIASYNFLFQSWTTERNETISAGSLAAGQATTLTYSWTPSTPGVYAVYGLADPEDNVSEVEEFNNLVEPIAFFVGVAPEGPENAPMAPPNLVGAPSDSRRTDAAVVDIVWTTEELEPTGNTTFTATIRNDGPDVLRDAVVTIEAGRSFGGQLSPLAEATERVTIPVGQTRSVRLTWTELPGTSGSYWVQAYVNTTDAGFDPDAQDNHLARSLAVNVQELPQPDRREVPDRLTIKFFYVQILSLVHLRILLPFIALFYAAGTISDERARGSLAYVLTRPVPRWLLPIAKFGAGFLVALLAIVVGILATFALLFGLTPQGDVGFLTTPLLMALVTLFVYGAFFTMLGVLVDRPYLVGAGFVGWELVVTGDILRLVGLTLPLAPWVPNLTVFHHLANALTAWSFDEGLQWLPGTDAGVEALRNILLAGLAFLAVAAYAVRRREFAL